jgi:hypothetical protein
MYTYQPGILLGNEPIGVPTPTSEEVPVILAGLSYGDPEYPAAGHFCGYVHRGPVDIALCRYEYSERLKGYYFSTITEVLAENGLTPECLTQVNLRAAQKLFEARVEASNEAIRANNRNPDRKVTWVMEDSLDPDLNPRLRAQVEADKLRKQADEAKKHEHLAALKAWKEKQKLEAAQEAAPSDIQVVTDQPKGLASCEAAPTIPEPQFPTIAQEERDNAMATATSVLVIDKGQAVQLFEELGFKAAGKWDASKWAPKLRGLKKILDPETQPTTDESKALLATILAAVDEKRPIKVGSPTPHASKNGTAAPAKPKKEKAKKPKAEKAPKAPRETIPLDAFGSRLGSGMAKLNKQFSATPQPIQVMMRAAGVSGGNYPVHVRKLTADGFLEKTTEGVKLTRKGEAAAAKN